MKNDDEKRPAHRPTKLTPEVRKKILDLLRVGNFRETAAAAAGIDARTVRTWLKWGAEGKAPFEDFSAEMDRAEAEAEAMGLMAIAKAASHDWRAAAWRLERISRERWGQKTGVEVSGKNGGPVEITLSAIDAAMKACEANELDDD